MERTDVIEKVERQFQNKRQRAEAEAQARFDFACQNDEFKQLIKEERTLQYEMGKNLHFGKSVEEQKKQLSVNKLRQRDVLKKLKLTPEDLLPNYDCKICNDTGVAEGKRCSCFRNAVNGELLSNSKLVDKSLTLNNFEPQNKSQERCAEKLKIVAEKAPETKIKNIVLSGPTGTGKTYLVNCLANDLLKRNFSVMFTSAFNFNNLLLSIHLAPLSQKEEMLNNLIDTDVLVIDDLGSENILQNVTEQYTCNILNERLCHGKYTFITTNLDMFGIQDRYGERIMSRLLGGDTLKIKLDGSDLRLTK